MNRVFHSFSKIFKDWRYPASVAGAFLVVSVVIAQLITIPGQRNQQELIEKANTQRLCIAVETGKAILYISEVVDASIRKDPEGLITSNELLQKQAIHLSEEFLKTICPGPK